MMTVKKSFQGHEVSSGDVQPLAVCIEIITFDGLSSIFPVQIALESFVFYFALIFRARRHRMVVICQETFTPEPCDFPSCCQHSVFFFSFFF